MNASAKQARDVFVAAVKLGSNEWDEYLADACGADVELRDRVKKLLAAHLEAGSFLAAPAAGAEMTVDAPLQEGPGTVIGSYKLLEQIGEGGFGVVFMAEQSQPVRRKVALKVLKPGMDTRQVVARFEAERQALAIMDHPNIAKVHDGGATSSGRPYFVMELVKGVPITEYCDQNHLTPRQRLELFVPICHAVQHAHHKGIIHRDLKPSNVLITVHDTMPVPKVIDFGVAKALGQELTEKTLFTGFAQMIGTPLYMSPEQAGQSSLDVDTRSDIYSLGVLLYELLTGTTPFNKERFKRAAYDEIRRIIREEEPPKPSTRLSESTGSLPSISAQRQTEPAKLTKLVRGELDWIVMKALEKDRNRRYETANGFAADVLHYLTDEPVQASPPSAVYRLRKLVRRHKGPAIAAALVAVALLAGIIGTTIGLLRADRERAIAARERDDKQEAIDALGLEQQQTQTALTAETQARRQAMKALSRLTDKIVERQLAGQVTLDASDRDFLMTIVAEYEGFARLRGEGEESRAIRADGYFRTGLLRDRLGERAEAKASYEQARNLYQQLVADFGMQPYYRRRLAACHDHLGILLSHLGQRAEAEAQYRQSLALGKQLTADFPVVPDYRRGLAGTHMSLGIQLAHLNRREEAEAEYRQALDHQKMLVADAPAEPSYRQELAASHGNLANLLRLLGRRTEARDEIRQAIDLRKRLAADFPSIPEYRGGLAASHMNLGNVLVDLDKRAEAETEYRQAIDLQEQLAATFPVVPEYRDVLAGTHYNLGRLLGEQGKWKEAQEAYRRAIDLRKQLAGQFPREPRYRRHLAASHNMLGNLLDDLGKRDAAEEQYRQSLGLRKQLVTDFSKVPDDTANLGSAYCNLGILGGNSGRPAEALDWYQQAIQTLTPVMELTPVPPGTRRWLCLAFTGRARALMKLERFAEAVPAWERAIELDKGPSRQSIRWERAVCLARAEPARAAAEAEAVARDDKASAKEIYDAARVYSLASINAKVADERERYAVQAGALLRRTFAAGLFRNEARVKDLYLHSELDPLRQRPEFRKLVTELEASRGVRLLEGHTGAVWFVGFSADSRRALSASHDKTLRLWDVETERELRCFQGHAGHIYGAALSADAHRILSGGDDGTLRLWDADTGKELQRLEQAGNVNCVAFTSDGRWAVLGRYDGLVRLWDVANWKELRRANLGEGVWSLDVSRDGRHALIAGGRPGKENRAILQLWKLEGSDEPHLFDETKSKGLGRAVLSPDGGQALSAGTGMRLWDVGTGKELRSFLDDKNEVLSVAFAPDGRHAVSATPDGTVRVWEVGGGEVLGQLTGYLGGHARSVAYSPDGRQVLIGTAKGLVYLWRLPSSEKSPKEMKQ